MLAQSVMAKEEPAAQKSAGMSGEKGGKRLMPPAKNEPRQSTKETASTNKAPSNKSLGLGCSSGED
jgi:hypothetical protein